MRDLIRQAKKRKFDATLWGGEKRHRISYAWHESDESCSKPGVGMITYPCCPYCGARRGPDNRDFVNGAFCDEACRLAYKLHYNEDRGEILLKLKAETASKKINLYGDGI